MATTTQKTQLRLQFFIASCSWFFLLVTGVIIRKHESFLQVHCLASSRIRTVWNKRRVFWSVFSYIYSCNNLSGAEIDPHSRYDLLICVALLELATITVFYKTGMKSDWKKCGQTDRQEEGRKEGNFEIKDEWSPAPVNDHINQVCKYWYKGESTRICCFLTMFCVVPLLCWRL